MTKPEHTEQFVQQLTESQNRLYGYVFSLLGDRAAANDVVQETNLVLWRKLDEFDPSRPFLPWAFAVARFQVLANLRDKKRDRLLLDEDLADKLGSEVESASGSLDAVREALRGCLQKLPPQSRDLVQHRYLRSMSVADVADALGRTVGATKVALLRARKQLAACIERTLTAEVSS